MLDAGFCPYTATRTDFVFTLLQSVLYPEQVQSPHTLVKWKQDLQLLSRKEFWALF